MREGMNEAQARVVEAEGPVVCCACPGSGKTRVLVHKVRHILSTHADPYVVMTTFSRDAADEMLSRIRELGAEAQCNARVRARLAEPARLVIGTFHALALRQLGERRGAKILSDVETRHLIARALNDTKLKLSAQEADAGIAHCKADPAFASEHPDLARLTACYQRHQAAAGACDFTDILLSANRGMAEGTVAPLRATHLLSDETQDIDEMQYDWLMHHVATDAVLTATGDDDQSIFSFRRSLGYRGMMRIAGAVGATIIPLDTNYRSTASIVDAARQLVEFNVDRVPKAIRAARGPGRAPQVVWLSDTECQASTIVRMLEDLCRGNPVPEPLPGTVRDRFGVRMGQAAVLARTNRQLGDIENIFRQQQVPYLRVGKSFWDRPILQVLTALLGSLAAGDEIGLEIALRWAGIGEGFLRRQRACTGGLREVIARNDTPDDEGVWGEFCVLARAWIRKLQQDPESPNTAHGVIEGVARWMAQVVAIPRKGEREEEGAGKPPQRVERELRILQAARGSLAGAAGSLQTRLYGLRRRDTTSVPRVILSTFHASKGLEWETVFLVDVHEGSVPKLTGPGSVDEMDEERRVFYVAMTRARDRLVILARRDKPVSPFLEEANLTGDYGCWRDEQKEN